MGSLTFTANHVALKMKETGLQFVVLIREDLNVYPFAVVLTQVTDVYVCASEDENGVRLA